MDYKGRFKPAKPEKYKGDPTKITHDVISDFLGISPLDDVAIASIEADTKKEKEENSNKNSQVGILNNFFGCNHTAESKYIMSIKAKLRKSNRIGKKHSEMSKKIMSEKAKGKTLSDETREKMSDSKKGSIISEECRLKISQANKGKIRTEEQKLQQSIIAKNRRRIVCLHCGKEIDVSNYTRWHGSNCKDNTNGL